MNTKLAILQCPHGLRSIATENPDGSGARLSAAVCCKIWNIVEVFVLSDAEGAAEELLATAELWADEDRRAGGDGPAETPTDNLPRDEAHRMEQARKLK